MDIRNDAQVFFKDMMELQAHNQQFLKAHWKGYIVYTVAGTAVSYGVMMAAPIVADKTKEGFNKVKTNIKVKRSDKKEKKANKKTKTEEK